MDVFQEISEGPYCMLGNNNKKNLPNNVELENKLLIVRFVYLQIVFAIEQGNIV